MDAFDDFDVAPGEGDAVAAFDPNAGMTTEDTGFGFDVESTPVVEDNTDNMMMMSNDNDTVPMYENKVSDVFAEEEINDQPLREWKEERAKVLAERSEKAVQKKQRTLEQAEADLAKFHKDCAEKLASVKKENRQYEKDSKTSTEELMNHGGKWEKVDRLTNLKPSSNKEVKTDRMRKLLIQLKNEKQETDEVKN